MVARPLPWSNVPNSPDWVSGQWNGRLNDSGDFSITFPNKEATDGGPWRLRFDPGGKTQWIEIWNDGYLEHAGCIQKTDFKRDSVTISGNDGWFQLKSAYERDWITIQAPRDVIDRGTWVWQTLVADNFNYLGDSIPDASQWTASSSVAAGPNNAGLAVNDGSWNPIGAPGQTPWTFSATSFFSWAGATFLGSYGYVSTNYGFSVPGGSSIVGIQAAIQNQISLGGSLSSGAGFYSPVLVISGARTVYAANHQSGQPLSFNTPDWGFFGNQSDTWNGAIAVLTPALVNASNFGIEFQAELESDGSHTMTFTIFTIQMTVWYTSSAAVAIRTTGGLALNVTSVFGNSAVITSTTTACNDSTVWAAESSMFQLPASGAVYYMRVKENGTNVVDLEIANGLARLYYYDVLGAATQNSQVTPTSSATWDLRAESDGEWISGFINGQLVGHFRRPLTVPNTLSIEMGVVSTGSAASAVVIATLLEAQQPFLMRTDWQRDTLTNQAGSGSNSAAVGAVDWNTPNNLSSTAAPGTLGTSITLTSGQVSHLLLASSFGFTVPTNASVTGVEASFYRYALAGGQFSDSAVYLLNSGLLLTGVTNHAKPGFWPAGPPPVTITYGTMTDQWGVTGGLTPSIVNSSTFGPGLAATTNTSTTSAWVYNPVTVTVYYTLPGGDWGDFVLPGDASTYPWGGLHARYFNNLDLQSDGARLRKIHSPARTTAFAGSGTNEYANQQDATINGQQNPLPGASTSGWSAVWFGAIYLKLSAGDYVIGVLCPPVNNDVSVRLWIGKTRFGAQLIDQWQFNNTSSLLYTCTVSASALAGTLPYGGGQVQRDGWYPIKLEYAVDSVATNAPALYFRTTPVAYADPGGTNIGSGFANIVVPATSLSPLGCVDQRHQGISHFDLVQKTAQAFGYQMSCEPLQLETLGQAQPSPGSFPGVLAPRIREGHDTDAILKPDVDPRTDGEGLVDYGNSLDATDNCTSLMGNGAGFQSGTSGQLQTEVYDPISMQESLFDIQGWQDFSDASFASLLQALLNSELGLRLTPWQIVTGQPQGKPRLAYTWPLPSSLTQMRWRPGDGLRVQAREVNIFDLSPRQVLVITRSIHPNGATGAQVNFAARPRTQARTLKKQLFGASRWQRNYQKQLVVLQTDISASLLATVASGAFTPYMVVALNASDALVRAQVRVALNNNGSTVNLEINGVDQTTALGGPWAGTPVVIDITGYATPASNDNRLYVRLKNNSGISAAIEAQLIVYVLR